MPLAQLVFSETSPGAAGTAASSQPVTGCESANMPAGVAGLFDDYESVDVTAEIQGATGGTLNLYLQVSGDQTNWYDVIAWTQATAGHAVVYYKSPLSLATTTTAPTTVGKNLTPALSGTVSVVNGAFTGVARLVMVAGSGTSQGAPVVVRLTPQRSRLREAGGS